MSTLVPTDPLPARPALRRLRFLGAVCLSWTLVTLLEVGILCARLLHPAVRSVVVYSGGPRPEGPPATRVQTLQLLAFELAMAAVVVAAVAAIVAMLAGLVRLVPVKQVLRGRIGAVLGIGLVWLAFVAFALSWGAFLTNGSFLDRDSIFFWLQLTHPFRLLFWSSPVIVSCLPVITGAAVLVAWFAVGWITRRMGRLGLRWLVCVSGGLAALLGIFSIASDPPPMPDKPEELLAVPQVSAERLWRTRRYHLGPCAAAMLDVIDIGSITSSMPQVSGNIPVLHPPQISMSEYLQPVDRAAVKPWNVIFVEVESMRADALRLFGARREIMPATDALAAESLAFDNANTQATHSNYAVACPLASQYPLRSAEPYSYKPNPPYPRVMIYDILKALGYRVGLFSSSNEHWFGMNYFLQTPSVDEYQDSEVWQGPTKLFFADLGFSKWAQESKHHGVMDDRFTVQSAMDWIDKQPAKPFFVYLNFQASHFPYIVPDDFPRRFSPATADFTMQFGYFPAEKTDVVRGMYDDSLRYVDAQLAKLYGHLKSRGLWDHTLVVLTGDHGQAFYEHGFVTHANMLYNELTHVPLIIRVPGQPGRVDHDPVQHVDVPPMLLHLMNLPPHPGFQGTDELNPRHSPHHGMYMMVQSPVAEQYALLMDGYKLIYDRRLKLYLLYDEKADPGELHDLAGDRTHAPALIDRLNTWRAAQLTYYGNQLFEKTTYAPVLPDPQ